MTIDRLLTLLLVGVIGWSCSSQPEQHTTYVSGNISVADSVDSSGDFSGIGVTIIKKDSANAEADTLFDAKTDSMGIFSGTVQFPEKRRYPLFISRNNKNLAQLGVILADGDSLHVEGQLPNLQATVSISSKEHDVMATYGRINRNFQRIQQYIRAGQLKGDTLRQELAKWSNIYWQVYQDNKGTIASELSARQSVNILSRFNSEEMMSRVRLLQEEDALSDLGASYGKNYVANNSGLEPALAYLDSLIASTEEKSKTRQIRMEQIKLLYDSARVSEAKKRLTAFKKKYPNDQSSKEWVESISYDLNYLSPGDSIPPFQFTQSGTVISRDSLVGTPYILEITQLSNRLYQNQFDRTVVIHSIYKNYGLEIITLPLDNSQVTVDAFFEERLKPWPVSDAQAFDRKELVEKFNVNFVPTRFLIDREGKIVRKYVGNEYQDVIKGIQSIIKQDKEPPS